MNQISVHNLSVHYGDNQVLKDINFSVKQGEFVTIVGKSGSGKTTFLHALANLIPYTGTIETSGEAGIILQKHAIFPWLTVSGNIAFGLKNQKDRNRVIDEYLTLAGLEEKRDKYPAELSGGQVQRVALARALAHNPEVLLMDEPYGALDAYTRDKMQQWLLNVWTQHKKTIIFVTHDIEEAIFLSDRVFILDNGKFTHEFTVPFERPREENIKFTAEFGNLRKRIFGAINSEITSPEFSKLRVLAAHAERGRRGGLHS